MKSICSTAIWRPGGLATAAPSSRISRGFPDGSCLDDTTGLSFHRVAGGSAVACFDTTGALSDLVELPASWPTSCTFGGAGLDTLYVTSARFTMSAAHLAANPGGRRPFAVTGAGHGRPEPVFGASPNTAGDPDERIRRQKHRRDRRQLGMGLACARRFAAGSGPGDDRRQRPRLGR